MWILVPNGVSKQDQMVIGCKARRKFASRVSQHQLGTYDIFCLLFSRENDWLESVAKD